MSKRYLLSILLSTMLTQTVNAQLFVTRAAHVNIQSNNNLKKIEADNYQISSIIDLSKNSIRFEGLLKSFEFKLGLLDRVFHSDKVKVNNHPKFRFEGTITGLENIDLANFGEYSVTVDGTLYLWDEKRRTKAQGSVTSIGDGKQIFASSGFTITIEEASLKKMDKIIQKKIPLNLSTSSIGLSRDILILLDASYKTRN